MVSIFALLEKVRAGKPLVHHLTNWVTIYDCANIVKVFGASPVMAHAKEEVADMAGIASALVLNIGTLTPGFVDSMLTAAKAANKKGIPVILDVCGAGATKLRDDKCFEIIDNADISIIKGNASEVARIAGEEVQTKGVDAVDVGKNLSDVAKRLSEERHCTVVITGKKDIIVDGNKQIVVKNGHEIMAHIVGTGCMATSVIGTFAAVAENPAEGAAAGLACFEIAAELARKECGGAGSFKVCLFDAVYNLNEQQIESMAKVEQAG